MAASPESIEKAKEIVAYYTLAAAATGAVPVPAASGVIVFETTAMLAHIANVLGQEVSIATVAESVGAAGVLNMAGRAFFIEIAKALSWGTGSAWALFGLCAVGATTAGLQTYIIGRLGMEICKNGGKALSSSSAEKVIKDAKNSYDAFAKEWKDKKPRKPESVH